MEWNWSKEVQYLNEILPPDNLDRAKYAKFLYEVAAKRGETSNLVININAEWGAGKTHFTRRLAQTIKEKHPTVYVDAWKQDFSDDPLLAIFSSISDQLSDQSDKFVSLVKKTEKKVGILLKGIAPALIQGIIKKTTGIDEISEIAKSVTENVIELHKEKSAVIEDIKKDLAEWVKFIKQKDAMEKELPIFIFIDELDRCRPSYAIDLLEIVKHIFDVKGLVFFISTDTDQLQHSIKIIYGQDFNAQQYLGRFFDRRNVLAAPKTKALIEVRSPSNFVSEYVALTHHIVPRPVSFQDFTQTCSDILDAFKINLRDSLKYYERLCDIILTVDKNFDPFFLLIMICLFDKEPNLYKNVKNSQISKAHDLRNHKINEDTIKNLSQHLSICLDLSHEATGVSSLHIFQHFEKYSVDNNHKVETNKSSLIDYLEKSISIIKTKDAKSQFSSGGSQSEIPWSLGGILNAVDIETYLKMSWAEKKGALVEINFDEYFELIELSTTLE